jgi:hypothetical protein
LAKLKCKHKTNDDPYYKLGPVKEEEVHKDPSIWIFHDILSKDEQQAVRDTAAPLVNRILKFKKIKNKSNIQKAIQKKSKHLKKFEKFERKFEKFETKFEKL